MRTKASILQVEENPGIEAAYKVFTSGLELLEQQKAQRGRFAGIIEEQRQEWRLVEKIINAYIEVNK